MKKIYFFKTKSQYDKFAHEQIFTDKLITDVPLYEKLVQFVCNEKAPVFFEASEYSENRNFQNYVNWQVMRDYYDNKLVQNMFYLHEFMHMAQDLPVNAEASREDFENQFVKTEYVASDETEVLIHYRTKKIRAKVFTDRKILYDVIADKLDMQPSARQLLGMRQELVETNHLMKMFAGTQAEQAIANELHHYSGSRKWARDFYDRVAECKLVDYPFNTISAENYEYRLLNYDDKSSQAKYEKLTLINIQNMFALLNRQDAPKTFAQCEAAVKRLEGEVFDATPVTKKESEVNYEAQLVTA